MSRVSILCTALACLALTAYWAVVPYWPIEISKMGNYGAAYWSFSIGGTATALQILHLHRRELHPLMVFSCACLSGLTIFSDAGFPVLHMTLALCFFASAIAWTRSTNGGWPFWGALAAYSVRLLLLPFQLAAADPTMVQRVRAPLQWATVGFLLAGLVMQPRALKPRRV